ncbi:hypothetical protein [Aquipuribacter sp. SD81]|uniref:hypothetical protein n=1 Tax=Aquipuribacter sp. SD81 TaxID=3127703 RepID=UPI00301ABAC8
MSENTEYPTGTTGEPDDLRTPGDETGAGYDPDSDPDADPEMLNPRDGDEAAGSQTEDPDSDPDSMNPREGDA